MLNSRKSITWSAVPSALVSSKVESYVSLSVIGQRPHREPLPKKAPEPAKRALEPTGKSSEPAGRAAEPAGRPLEPTELPRGGWKE